jgi:hypothetical protein
VVEVREAIRERIEAWVRTLDITPTPTM